ncbi:MAG: Asp23/Gls24 family envelope stress response protein [Clostridiales Family XIII bacterium]|jgi:uncharacterized alkaline shock family protein YloU|nr:Asp23/Gls24 family envelope stress response protein [Clostridiales Family XIII bacterium]
MSDNELRADEQVAAYVCGLALGVAGVYGMGLTLSASALGKSLLGQDKKARGVRVAYDDDTGYTIDVYIIAAYGANIPEMAWNVQKHAFDGLKNDFGIEPKSVNIHIQGVHTG